MTDSIQTNGSGSVYVTSAGKVLLNSSSIPNIESLNITPTTSVQTITATGGVDGYSPINVSAVTSSIDQNISAGNIKKDVQILGITGTYEGSGSGIGIPREVKNGVYIMPTENFTFSLPSDATDIGFCALSHTFEACQTLISIDLSSLITVSGGSSLGYAFSSCSKLASVNLSSLTTVSGGSSLGYAFSSCASLTSIDLSSLTTVSGNNAFNYAFQDCTSLTSVDLSSLTTVSSVYCFSNAFKGCTRLTSIDLSSLTTISNNYALQRVFIGCTGLTDVYFRALTTSSFGTSYTNQFSNMMQSTGTTTTHTLHFPSNLQSTISSLSGYPTFGGTSGYVTLAFDLPTTS